MSSEKPDVIAHDPNANLEQALIAEFLAKRGHTTTSIRALPPEQAAALLRDACLYASGRMTEVESRAHYVDDLRKEPA